MARDRDGELQDQADFDPPVPGILAMADCLDCDRDVQRLIDVTAECLIAMGVDVTILDLNDLHLPRFFEADGSSAVPPGVLGLRQLLCAHDAFVIALPRPKEGDQPLLMNAVEWSLSTALGDRPKGAYTGKCAALMSVAQGEKDSIDPFAAARGTLSSLGVTVLPEQFMLAGGAGAFEGAHLADEEARLTLANLMERLVATIAWERHIPPAA